MPTLTEIAFRRVVLLETDERAGLVAAIAAACAAQDVSLEITTGPGHVLLALTASDDALPSILSSLEAVPGVGGARSYVVRVPGVLHPQHT